MDKQNNQFYSIIGRKSWQNPDRNRNVGFAKMSPEERAELGRKGGKTNKGKKYVTKKRLQEAYEEGNKEALAILEQAKKDYAGPS